MHFDAFDRYHEAESFLHRLDPRVKVVATVAFILSNALLPDGAWIEKPHWLQAEKAAQSTRAICSHL